MPTLVSATELKTHVPTGLADAALDRILDDAEEMVIKRHGPLASVAETRQPARLVDTVYLSRKASSITTVAELVDETVTALAADDYELVGDRRLRRLDTGTNGREFWGDRVVVTYVPEDDTNRRVMVIIDLARLAIEYRAATADSLADYSRSHVDYERERNRILRRLGRRAFA